MRILVLGGDGYLGWPTALHLSQKGHDVGVVDNFVRRQYDYEMGVDTLVPIRQLQRRVGDVEGRLGPHHRSRSSATSTDHVFVESDPARVPARRDRPLRRAARPRRTR